MSSLISAALVATGQVQSLDSVRGHSLPSDAMIVASATQVNPVNQNPGSYAIVESGINSLGVTTTGSVPAVTQSPFADLYKEGSVYFNGTAGNYLQNTATFSNSTIQWSTAGMTIEAWVNYTTFTGASNPSTVPQPTLFGLMTPTNAGNYWSFGSNTAGYVNFCYYNGQAQQAVMSLTPLSTNTWNHIAMTCTTSGQIFLFVNGIQTQIVANRNGTLQSASYYETVQGTPAVASYPLTIGQWASLNTNAYLADLRLTTGTPLYTGSTSSYATFTVPSAPLSPSATGATQFLLRAGQNSPTIQNGALTFDRGLKQYMNFGPQQFNIATRGFTCVFRYTWNGTVGNNERIFQAFPTAGSQASGISITRNGTNAGLQFVYSLSGSYTFVNSATTLSQGTNYVAAFVYNASTGVAQWWINGAPSGSSVTGLTSSITTDYLCPWTLVGSSFQYDSFGNFSSNTLAVYNRALSNVEIYNAFLSLSTTPATPQQKTLEIGDINSTPALSVAGDGKVSVQSVGLTSNVLPWPPAALSGYDTVINGGVYKARASSELSGYTAWYGFEKSTSAWASNSTVPYGSTAPYNANASSAITVDVNGTSYQGEWLQIQMPSQVLLSSYALTPGAGNTNQSPAKWVILGSRDGVNWTLVDSRSSVTTWTAFTAQTFSMSSSTSQSYNFYRIVVNQLNGYNVSTAVCVLVEWTLYGTADTSPSLTIAPATTFSSSVATPSLSGISTPGVYVPQDFSSSGLNIPAYVVSNTATVANTVAFSSFGPFAGEGSLYFPGGSAPRISFGVQSQFAYNWTSYDFTMECFVYNTSRPVDQHLLSRDNDILMYVSQSTYPNQLVLYSAGITSPTSGSFLGGTVPLNQWNHLAVSYIASTSTVYLSVNGSVTTVPKVTGTFQYTGTNNTNIDYWFGGSGTNIGYLASFRFTRGLALYTGTFTPPTGPLQPIQGTTQAGLPYGTVLLLRNAPAPGRIQTTKFSGANSVGLGGAPQVLSFPPAAMTGYSTALNAGYGQGTYVASASSEFSGYYAWYAFDQSASTYWVSVGGGYNTSSPYNYTGAVTTTDVNGTSYSGDWLQIQLPASTVLSSYTITNNGAAAAPQVFFLLGSRDGTNWFLIDSRSGITWSTSGISQTFTVASGQAFIYFRIVTRNVAGNGGYVQIIQMTLNGSIEGLCVSPDGKVGIGVSNPTRSLEVAGPIINGNPAFTAFRSVGAVAAPATIVFDTAPLNRWNAYSTSTGLFTAPVTGLYFFSFWGMTATSAAIWVQFYKNGSLVNNGGNPYQAYPSGGPAGTYNTVSGTIIIPMVVGDTANMYLNTGSLYGGGNCHNGYVGYLIG